MEELFFENLLNQVDIVIAINYYGVTELLDVIGEERIREYLKSEL